MDEVFYHSSPTPLETGSTILPGNYGNIIQHYGSNHPLFEREMLLEEIRKINYPEKPSRLNCCFLCRTIPEMLLYLRLNCFDQYQYIYEAAICQTDKELHIGNYCCLPPTKDSPPVAGKEPKQLTIDYWEHNDSSQKMHVPQYPGVPLFEVVTASPIRLVSSGTPFHSGNIPFQNPFLQPE
ncbi:hypothetical protein DA717_11235 [Piscirickettsiaceae bacterium NZ-RLO2]|nr:hypothetical protein DA717_11235 [Piscirickettsiaceae bacterium NZ-RLO2]